jgi:hypothetical protein
MVSMTYMAVLGDLKLLKCSTAGAFQAVKCDIKSLNIKAAIIMENIDGENRRWGKISTAS